MYLFLANAVPLLENNYLSLLYMKNIYIIKNAITLTLRAKNMLIYILKISKFKS